MRLGTESDNYMLSLLPTLLSELLFSVELKNKRLCVFKRRARKKAFVVKHQHFFKVRTFYYFWELVLVFSGKDTV